MSVFNTIIANIVKRYYLSLRGDFVLRLKTRGDLVAHDFFHSQVVKADPRPLYAGRRPQQSHPGP
jgi:hypothetical protein